MRILAALLSAPALLLGCSFHCGAVATTGATYMSQQYDSPWQEAARDSAAHDLHCAKESVTVAILSNGKSPASDYLADGCGKRANYHCAPASLTQTCTMVLVSKFDV